jgi:hypothetical protein
MKAVWQKILSYLTLRPQESPDGKPMSFNLRAMHTINKISIFMFLVALVILFIKFVF